MTKKILILLLILFAGLALWLLFSRKSQIHDILPNASLQKTDSTPTEPKISKSTVENNPSNSKITAQNTNDNVNTDDFYKQTRIDPTIEWKMPISFYGRVVDESNAPVANASVHFNWTDLSPTGTSHADKISDSNGFFSLTDQHGKRMSVTISKDGYYGTSTSRQSFEYAQPEMRFVPDQNNPVVFHLRKKGVGADLITSQFGMSAEFVVKAPRDGSPVKVDLMQRKSGSDGQLEISQIKPEYKNWMEVNAWSFKMEIRDGGFIEENDEFPFEAPEDGYQPSVEFDLKKDQPNWTPEVQKDYYIKFGSPPRYGHLHLETSLMLNGARLTYTINPDGSHYLEPK
jgi:hypothetical protein